MNANSAGIDSNPYQFLGVLGEMAIDDFFRARLDSMMDMRHPLAMLLTRMPWAESLSARATLIVGAMSAPHITLTMGELCKL